MIEKAFKTGIICVVVTTKRGETHTEDWAYQDRGEARIYAKETSCCDDVEWVAFESTPLNKREIFVNGELTAIEPILAEAA